MKNKLQPSPSKQNILELQSQTFENKRDVSWDDMAGQERKKFMSQSMRAKQISLMN